MVPPTADLKLVPTISEARTYADNAYPVIPMPVSTLNTTNCHTEVMNALVRTEERIRAPEINMIGFLPNRSAAIPRGMHPIPHPIYIAEFPKATSQLLSQTRSNYENKF